MGNRKAEIAAQRARLGEYFLARLGRLTGMRRSLAEDLGGEPFDLLDFALVSTFGDCMRLGLRREAWKLLVAGCEDEDCSGSWAD